MRYWDSSALVAVVVEEKATRSVRALMRSDPEAVVWILSEIEIASALWRRRRGAELSESLREEAQRQVDLILALDERLADAATSEGFAVLP